MRVAILTTSYPRYDGDYAGRFIADQVERLEARGVEADIVAPGRYRDFELAYGGGVANNVRRRPWAGPPLVASMTRSARRAARTADLVHAHWLPVGAVAALSGKPFVVTLHGTDVEIARRAPRLARAVLRRASSVIAVSRSLARETIALGADSIEVIPNGVELPVGVAREAADPLEVLFVGRLSPEKGVTDLLSVADGLDLVIVGDGPLRGDVPQALGFLSRTEYERRLARAAVVVCPSRREGFGLTCAEAMAFGKPVVATAVGGLRDLVVDGETGILVPLGKPESLRVAIDRLLADGELRRRLGAAGRERVAHLCDWDTVTSQTLAAYSAALR